MAILIFDPSMNNAANAGLLVDSNDLIWFSAQDSDGYTKVVRYNPVSNTWTKYLNPWAHTVGTYGPVVQAPNGDLYFPGYSSSVRSVIRFRPSDESWTKWDSPLTYQTAGYIIGIAVDRNGVIYLLHILVDIGGGDYRDVFGSLNVGTGQWTTLSTAAASQSYRILTYCDTIYSAVIHHAYSSVTDIKKWDIAAGAFGTDLPAGLSGNGNYGNGDAVMGDILYSSSGKTGPYVMKQVRLSTNQLIASSGNYAYGENHPMRVSPIDGTIWQSAGVQGAKVYRFDGPYEGTTTFTLPVDGVHNPGQGPYGIGIDSQGNVWIVTNDSSSQSVRLYEIGVSQFVPTLRPQQIAGKFNRGFE
ncbi:MAG: hypothetical protein HY760_07930 [Nitrospirae bacterium]|nr:hypothetical protein [Nitrospirota bacterium]